MSSGIPAPAGGGKAKGIPPPSRIRPPGSATTGATASAGTGVGTSAAAAGTAIPTAVARSASSASLSLQETAGRSRSLSNASSASNLASETEAGRGVAAAAAAMANNTATATTARVADDTVVDSSDQLGSPGQPTDGSTPNHPSDILTHDPEDFIIGDRVWVNGSKPGYIQFIGETKFAQGDWAGVVLDEPIGKNDGAVAGHRYFQCEPRRGVFARLQRLTRYPTTVAAINAGPNDSTLIQESPGKSVTTRTIVRPGSPAMTGRTTPSSPRAVITNTESVAVDHGLRIGDRVIVNTSSGFKAGVLHYIGATEFAQGHWCGVELDEPTGKNDGSVNGKRYFTCRPKYGLFAPVHKVARAGGSTTTTVHTTTRTTKVTSPPRLLSRTGSRESIASNVSSTSTSSKTSLTAARQLQQRHGLKPRLGVTALADRAAAVAGHQQQQQQHQQQQQQQQQASQHTSTTGNSSQSIKIKSLSNKHTALPSQSILQDALREKEEHIEQLLKERDLEQTEIARVTAHHEEAETKLHALQVEYAKASETAAAEQKALRQSLAELERERDELKRKLEDFQFELEELQINKADAEQERKDLAQKVTELEEALRESANGNGSENSSSQANLKLVEIEAAHRQQIDEMKRKLEDARGELKAIKDMRQNDSRSQQETDKAIVLKQEQLKTLDNELSKSKKECEHLRAKVDQLENELFEMAEKSQEIKADEIDDLRSKLRESEKKLIEERQSLLKTQKERTDLLAQCDIFETQLKQLQQTNDHLQEQLTNMTSDRAQLTGKLEAELDVFRTKLQDAELGLAREKSSLAKLLDEKDKLEFEFQEARSKLEDNEKNLNSSNSYVSQLESEKKRLQDDLEALHNEIAEKELRALEGERTAGSILQDKIAETEKLRCQLVDRDDRVSQLTKNIGDLLNEKTALCNELETLRTSFDVEKKNTDVALKKLEHERESLRFELESTSSGLNTELDNLKSLLEQTIRDADAVRVRLTTTQTELEQARARETKMACDLENALSTRVSADSEAEQLRAELQDIKVRFADMEREKAKAERDLEQEADHHRTLEQKLVYAETLLAKEREVAKRRIEDVEETLSRARRIAETQNSENHDILNKLHEEKDNLQRQVDQLRKSARDSQDQLDEARRSSATLEEVNDRLGRELDAVRKLIESTASDKDRNVERLLGQLEDNRRYEDKLQGELVDAINDAERLRTDLSDSQRQLEDLKCELKAKSERLSRTEESLRKHEMERKEQVLSFKSQMEGLRNEFDRYRRTLEVQLDGTKATSSEIEGQRELVEELHRQLSLKKAESQQSSAEVTTLRMRIADLENRLERQQSELDLMRRTESGRNRSRSRSPTKSPLSGTTAAHDEEKDAQIDFLNSIIVDMQRKVDEYRARIQILEAVDPSDIKRISASNNGNIGASMDRPAPRGRACRVFCDICEVFDSHETDDCPKQSNDTFEPTNHSHHAGGKGPSKRPYCSNCEMFGHLESECDLEEF